MKDTVCKPVCKPALLTLQLSQATNFVFKLYIRYIIKTTQLAGIHQKTLDKWLLQQQKNYTCTLYWSTYESTPSNYKSCRQFLSPSTDSVTNWQLDASLNSSDVFHRHWSKGYLKTDLVNVTMHAAWLMWYE